MDNPFKGEEPRLKPAFRRRWHHEFIAEGLTSTKGQDHPLGEAWTECHQQDSTLQWREKSPEPWRYFRRSGKGSDFPVQLRGELDVRGDIGIMDALKPHLPSGGTVEFTMRNTGHGGPTKVTLPNVQVVPESDLAATFVGGGDTDAMIVGKRPRP